MTLSCRRCGRHEDTLCRSCRKEISLISTPGTRLFISLNSFAYGRTTHTGLSRGSTKEGFLDVYVHLSGGHFWTTVPVEAVHLYRAEDDPGDMT